MAAEDRRAAGVRVGRSKHGKGAFATRAFGKGAVVMAAAGGLYSYAEIESGFRGLEGYFLQIGKDLYQGPSGGPDNFLNHSCDPNVGVRVLGEGRGVVFFALRPIAAGEELAMDYSTTMDEDDWEMDCECGAPSCRGKIRDFRKLPQALRTRYARLGAVPEYLLRYVPRERFNNRNR